MRRKLSTKTKTPAYHAEYSEKKNFFSDKEIIFRSRGRAKVLTITSKAQVVLLCLFFLVGLWSFYSYHLYSKTGNILHNRDKELLQTRDAYVELMSDFVALHNNVSQMLGDIKKRNSKAPDIDRYQIQAEVLEGKIKQITTDNDWVSDEKVAQRININEALLQRDIAVSERDELKNQMTEMQDSLEEIRSAELEVFDRLKNITSKEVQKLKATFNDINAPLKKKGLYFNPLANNKKNGGKGGPYIPDLKTSIKDKKLSEKITGIYKNVEDLQYYRQIVDGLPVGKPVWSYWVTSNFGSRSDPFMRKRANHKGVDLASRTGNKIKTMAAGKVIKAEYSRGYGNLVVVDHGNGFQTKYGHMNKIYSKKGQHVKTGDTVGEVGSTGRSTGPHLHYEVLYLGKNVDPVPFIKAKKS